MRLAAALLLVLAASSQAQTTADEELLKNAGVKTDGPGLLDYFGRRELTEERRKRIGDLIDRLSSGTFREREKATAELLEIGVAARPALKTALENRDPEVRRRAKECLDAMERQASAEVEAAAVRLLKDRKPDGACPALLRFLPTARDEAVEEEVLAALLALGVKGGKLDEALVKALDDTETRRRGAAALVAGKAGDDSRRGRALEMMKKDPAHRVRLRAAQGLISRGEKAAVPGLIALLTQAPPEVAQQALDVLASVAGDRAPPDPLGDDALARKKVQANWDAWWEESENRVDLARLAGDAPWADPNARAAKAVRGFLDGLASGDGEAIRRSTDAPFCLAGVLMLNTREDVEKTFQPLVKGGGPQKWEYSTPKLIDLASYLRNGNEKVKEFVDRHPRSQLRVFSVNVTTATVVGERAMLLVRVRGGQAHVVGLGPSQPVR